MDYLLEITKIIDGGIRSDRGKVIAYAEQLARKVEESGNKKAATRIRGCLSNQDGQEVSLNDFAPAARLPVDSESRLYLADETDPVAVPPFVALAPEIRAQVDQFVRYVTKADELLARGVGISPSLLMYGPPGCGKTLLATHIASRLGLPLLVARSDSLISSFLGSTAKNLRSLFEHAMSRPSVLFLDEFDAFAKLRDDRHELGELKRVVVSLLQNIDAMDGRTVLIAASNHEHLLDPAVWRRFAYKLSLTLPGQGERTQMFEQFLGSYLPAGAAHTLAEATESLSGSQIRQIVNDSIRDMVLSGMSTIVESQILSRVVHARLADISAEVSSDLIKRTHELAPHVFTGKRLAEIFGRSPATVSRWLRK